VVHGQSEYAAPGGLWEAIRAGLIFHQDGAYTFMHDRIQQAATDSSTRSSFCSSRWLMSTSWKRQAMRKMMAGSLADLVRQAEKLRRYP
jgi:hypothetical protein